MAEHGAAKQLATNSQGKTAAVFNLTQSSADMSAVSLVHYNGDISRFFPTKANEKFYCVEKKDIMGQNMLSPPAQAILQKTWKYPPKSNLSWCLQPQSYNKHNTQSSVVA